ncbi:MAG: RNA polymerase sigma factor [Planctomycetes bacterium]|nr:RNA polymerase sigma factor [Planctomycetota bacterium]
MDARRSSAGLVAAAQAGDRGALESLFDAYYPRVLRVAEVRLGKRLRRLFDPHDIAQSVFGEAYRRLPRFVDRGPGSFGGWLEEIVECTIRAKARWIGAARRNQGARESGPRLEARPGASSRTPSRIAAKEEEVERLRGAMESLGERDRRAVELRMYLGLGWSEVGSVLGLSDEAARKVVERAVEKVGRVLAGT